MAITNPGKYLAPPTFAFYNKPPRNIAVVTHLSGAGK